MKLLARIALLILVTTWARAQSSTLFTVEENGPRSKRINLVFLSEGYTSADMPNFATHVNNAVSFLFNREPWKQYRSYCNIYRIEIPSNESGTDNGSAGVQRDTYFSSGFNTPSVTQLVTLGGSGSTSGTNRAYALLNAHVPEYDVPVVLVNDTKYGGSGGTISVATVNASSAAVVEHEIGHSFASLADEYDVEYAIYTPGEKPNTTAQTTRELIRWNHWIDASTAIPTAEISTNDNVVGLFEGSMYRTTGWYRPHNNSLMRNLNRPCGAVNREQFVLKYYTLLGPVDQWNPATTTRSVTSPEALTFQVSPMAPSSGPVLVTSWKIDDVLQTGQSGTSFDTLSDYLGNGTHTVTAVVRDPTTFVRLDTANRLSQQVTWTFNLTNQLPTSLSAWRTAYGADQLQPKQDGYDNLLKYSLGLDPAKRIGSSQVPVQGRTTIAGKEYLTLTIPRRMRRADISYVVETCSDLAGWNNGAGHTVVLTDSDTLLVVRDAVPITDASKRFIRYRVVPN